MSFQTSGLHLEQAPPLAVPLSFFLTAPLAAAAAGCMLLWNGSGVLASSWVPVTLSLTHLGTLGFLTMVMIGALYQMIPVVAGSPVPWIRLAHGVHGGLLIGVAGLCWGIGQLSSEVVFWSIAVTGLSLLFFLVPMTVAMVRAPSRSATVTGMAVALGCLFLAAFIGLWLAHGHSGMRFPGPRPLWRQVHLSVALLGWVGGLISAVSWQVLPMFYLAEPVARVRANLIQGLIVAGSLLPAGVLGLDYAGLLDGTSPDAIRLATLLTLPAALAVWGLHPVISAQSLRLRRRRRWDATLLFWWAGLACAPMVGMAALATNFSAEPRWGLLFGWLALWGWAGMIVHGMLYRIVPFLVWFHRFAPRVGFEPVPSARGLLSDRRTEIGLGLHLASVVVGAWAILGGGDGAARAAGLLLLATAASLGLSLVHVARQRPADSGTRDSVGA